MKMTGAAETVKDGTVILNRVSKCYLLGWINSVFI